MLKRLHVLPVIALVLAVGCTSSDGENAGNTTESADWQTQDGDAVDAWTGTGAGDNEGTAANPEMMTIREELFSALDDLRQKGEQMYLKNPKLSDTEIRDDLLRSAGDDRLEADGATGIRIAVSDAEFTCSATIVFSVGSGGWNEIICS